MPFFTDFGLDLGSTRAAKATKGCLGCFMSASGTAWCARCERFGSSWDQLRRQKQLVGHHFDQIRPLSPQLRAQRGAFDGRRSVLSAGECITGDIVRKNVVQMTMSHARYQSTRAVLHELDGFVSGNGRASLQHRCICRLNAHMNIQKVHLETGVYTGTRGHAPNFGWSCSRRGGLAPRRCTVNVRMMHSIARLLEQDTRSGTHVCVLIAFDTQGERPDVSMCTGGVSSTPTRC